ncbi:MAG: tryptophan 7-halogenase [Pirellulales bacterium]|nr:tryptophan 7-halogenase [Pirellulales bacterium]
MNDSYDCLVIGGGPAGSTTATLVAEAGFSTLLVERDKMPRFHVGESLMPETYWTLQRLGVLEKMKASHFPKKFSVQFVGQSGRESAPFYFHDADPHESSQTWQVLRSEFDQMLFDNAREKGADAFDQARVLDVAFDGNKATGARVQRKGEEPREINARVVVDATGQQSLIANRLGLKDEYPGLRKASIWTYYRGARRDAGRDEGATIIMHTKGRKAWFWYIPLPDDVVSVGVVSNLDYLLKGRGTPEEVFEEELENCPAVKERVTIGERCDDYRVLRDFSYVSQQPAGEGWVLVGDAFGFLDPIYSSGVFLALRSGELAADAIVTGLKSDDLSAQQLGSWADEYASGMNWIRKLVYAYYNDDFSFGEFIRQHPQHRKNLTDLLVGKVFHEDAGRMFDDMEPWMAEANQAEEAMSRDK